MFMSRSMRGELFKYRKRKKKSFDGSVPGAPYASFRKSRRYVPGMPRVPGRPGYHHDLYLSGMPREYRPSLNAPAVQGDDYDPYEPSGRHDAPRPDNPRLPHDLNDNREMPGAITLPADDLTQTELLRRTLGKKDEIEPVTLEEPTFSLNELSLDKTESLIQDTSLGSVPRFTETAFDSTELTPDELWHKVLDLEDALHHLETVLPEEHPDIVNLKSAWHNIHNDPEAISKLISIVGDVGPSKFGWGDPYEEFPLEQAEQALEQQGQIVESQLGGTEMLPMETQVQDMFVRQSPQPEMIHGQFQPDDPFMEEQTLGDIVQQESPFKTPAPQFMEQQMPGEMMPAMDMAGALPEAAGHDFDMAADEINHAINQVTGQPMPEQSEPDPFQPQYDPFMAPEYLLDPEKPYNMPYYMMPGPVPFGPQMGPAGPMPGLLPGP